MTANIYSSNSSFKKNNKLFFLYFLSMSSLELYKSRSEPVTTIVVASGLVLALIGTLTNLFKNQLATKVEAENKKEEKFQHSKDVILTEYIENKDKKKQFIEKIGFHKTEILRLRREENLYQEQIYKVENLNTMNKKNIDNDQDLKNELGIIFNKAKLENLLEKSTNKKEDLEKNIINMEKDIAKMHKDIQKSIIGLFNNIVEYAISKGYISLPNGIKNVSNMERSKLVKKINNQLMKHEKKIQKQLTEYDINIFKDVFKLLKENLQISSSAKYKPKYFYNSWKFLNIFEEYKNQPDIFSRKNQKYLIINGIKFLKDDSVNMKFSEKVKKIKYLINTLSQDPMLKIDDAALGFIYSQHTDEYIKLVKKFNSKTDSFAVLLLLSKVLQKIEHDLQINPLEMFDVNGKVEKNDYNALFIYILIKDYNLFNPEYILQMNENMEHFYRIEIQQGSNREYQIKPNEYKNILSQLDELININNQVDVENFFNIICGYCNRKEAKEYKSMLNIITENTHPIIQLGENSDDIATTLRQFKTIV